VGLSPHCVINAGIKVLLRGAPRFQVIAASYSESYSSAHKAGDGEISGGVGMNTGCHDEFQEKGI
jgi:hypothetical protein